MISEIFRNSIRFFVLIFLQIIIIKNISLGAFLVPMPYIMFLLMLPFETPALLVMLFGFISGLTVDFFYDSQGIHSSASLMIGFMRFYSLKFISPREGYDVSMKPTIQSMGTAWFMYYVIPLILIHHLMFFILEEFGFGNSGMIFLKTIGSTAITLLFVYIFQFLFYRKDSVNT